MRRILVYGDSNTWGDTGFALKRYAKKAQWTNILQEKLGEKYEVIQEGLRGRYAGGFEFKGKEHLNGQAFYKDIFKRHSKVDMVIIALGTNDLYYSRYKRDPKDIAKDILWYEKTTEALKGADSVEFLYVLIPNFDSKKMKIFKPGKKMYEEHRIQVNGILKQKNINYVEENDLNFTDGLHFTKESHENMANSVYNKIKQMEEK